MSKSAPGAPLARYAAWKRKGDFIFLSGVIAVDASTGSIVSGYADLPEEVRGRLGQTGELSIDVFEGPIAAQSWFVLDSIRILMEEAGGSMADVFKLVQYFKDLRDYPGAVRDSSDAGFFKSVVASDAKHAAEDKAAQAAQGSLRGGADNGLANAVAQATAIFGPPPRSSGLGSMVDAAGQAKYRRQIADFVSHAYSADAPVRSKQMEMQYQAQMRGMKAKLWEQAGGDPIAYSKLASSMGMVEDPLATAKEMQTLGATASKAADTRIEHHAAGVNKNGEGYIDPGKLAVARNVRNSLAPGYQGLNEQEQSALQPDIDAGINITANKLRNTNWLQKLGWDQPDPLETTLPNMEGATASYVTPWEGLTTPDVSMGDVKMKLRGNSQPRFIPRDKFNENEMNLFKKQGGKFGNQ